MKKETETVKLAEPKNFFQSPEFFSLKSENVQFSRPNQEWPENRARRWRAEYSAPTGDLPPVKLAGIRKTSTALAGI